MLLAQLLWVGLAAVIMFVDRRLVEAKPASDTPDLTDRGIGQYLVFMVLFGAFVIPFYLWNSRKTSTAVVVGVALMVACALIVGLVLAFAH